MRRTLIGTVALAFLMAVGGSTIAIAGGAPQVSGFIDFESPDLGTSQRQMINPYIDATTGVVFTADNLPTNAIGFTELIKNSFTSACVEPSDDDQKLGTTVKTGTSFGVFPIRASFPDVLTPPVAISVEVQTLAGSPVRLRLFDSAGTLVASVTEVAAPSAGTCGKPGGERARTTLEATADNQVLHAVVDIEGSYGTVIVIDDFSFSAAAPLYEAIDLGTLGGRSSNARDINNHQQIVGFGATGLGSETLGYILSKGFMNPLDPPGGRWSPAVALNERGQVTGQARFVEGTAAYRWDAGTWTNLTPGNYSGGQDINDAGRVVGYWAPPGSIDFRGFLWDNGVVIDIGDLGGSTAWASAINNGNQIVGRSTDEYGRTRAFIWEKGVMTELGTLGGKTSSATDINDRGQVVGVSGTATGEQHAFLWENGVMIDLGTLGGSASSASAINARGQIVGSSQISTGSSIRHAFVWQNDVMIDLGTLGGATSSALGMNNVGQITGSAAIATGENHAVLWTIER